MKDAKKSPHELASKLSDEAKQVGGSVKKLEIAHKAQFAMGSSHYVSLSVAPQCRHMISEHEGELQALSIQLVGDDTGRIEQSLYAHLSKVSEVIRNSVAFFSVWDALPGESAVLRWESKTENVPSQLEMDYASFLSLIGRLPIFFFVPGDPIGRKDTLQVSASTTIVYYKDKQDLLENLKSSAATALLQRNFDEFPAIFVQELREPEPAESMRTIQILHLSDLHVRVGSEEQTYVNQLIADLRGLDVPALKYVVVSGDIAETGKREEYESARKMLSNLLKECHLSKESLIVVPGNHDVNWKLSKKAYSQTKGHGDQIKTPLTSEAYWRRFECFGNFFKQVSDRDFPLDPSKQMWFYEFEEDQIMFIGLNSCWQTDHQNTRISGINDAALTAALTHVGKVQYDEWLKIAVWHHPVSSPLNQDQDFKNAAIVESLAEHGVRLCLSGHVHDAVQTPHDGRKGTLTVIGVGTFGAPSQDRAESVPYQYNLIHLNLDSLVLKVESRRKDRPDGVWWADARWGKHRATAPEAHYRLEL